MLTLTLTNNRLILFVRVQARSMKEKVPKEAYTLFLPAVAVASYLDKLQQLDFDVFHPNLQRRNHWLSWTIFVNKVLNRY